MEELCNSLSRFEISHRRNEAKERYIKADTALAAARKAFRRADNAQSAAAEVLLDIQSPEWRKELCELNGNHTVDYKEEACQAPVINSTKRKVRLAERKHKVAEEHYDRALQALRRAEKEWESAHKGDKFAREVLEVKDEMMARL
jgi:hypothetical protein